MSVNQPQFPSNIILDALQIFANTAWHNPVAFLRTHHSSTSRDIEYLDVQNHSIALQYLFGNALAKCNKILVRDEYRKALQAFQSDSAYERGAFIIGQPGIGKTYFLIYALIKRLSEHKPVAIQLRTSDHFYTFFTHTCTLCPLSDPAPLVEEDVWALSDLRISTAPLDIFLDVSAKVIQANPCGEKHWEWRSRHHGAEMFVMTVWLVEEIADLSSLLALNVEAMVTLSSKWGGVPRTLLQQLTKSESQQDWELRRAATCAIENRTILHTLEAQTIGTISTIFFVFPPKDHEGNICRCRYVVRVPTAALQNALAITLQLMQSKTRTDFFLHLFDNPGTRVCARNLYMNWFYSQLTSGRGFFCGWLYQQHYHDERVRLSNELGSATQVKDIPVIWNLTEMTNTPCVWICPGGEIPAVDCAVITNSAIFAFQACTSFQPPIPSIRAALEILKKQLPPTWQNNRRFSWIFSRVAISEELLTYAPTNDTSNESSPVYIGSYGAVDPARARIPYKEFTYEDELEVDYEA